MLPSLADLTLLFVKALVGVLSLWTFSQKNVFPETRKILLSEEESPFSVIEQKHTLQGRPEREVGKHKEGVRDLF